MSVYLKKAVLPKPAEEKGEEDASRPGRLDGVSTDSARALRASLASIGDGESGDTVGSDD
jgi:hypothetical protein